METAMRDDDRLCVVTAGMCIRTDFSGQRAL
jgi:hypothetical protein